MPFRAEFIVLTDQQRQDLEQVSRSRILPATDVTKAKMTKIILSSADGTSYPKIEQSKEHGRY